MKLQSGKRGNLNSKEGNYFTPAWVIQDGDNKPFDTYIPCDEVNRIVEAGGLKHTDRIILHETEDKPIPESFKNGITSAVDILIVQVPGPAFKQ